MNQVNTVLFKSIALLFSLFTAINVSHSQTCLPSGIVLTSQQGIDDFATNYPGCTEILGSLRIIESVPGDITTLNGLSQITKVSGSSSSAIFNNTSLTNLDGLNISTVNGSFLISNNASLSNILGLSNLTSVGGLFSIEGNTNLTSLNGLNNLASVGSSFIVGSNALTNLSGLDNLSSIAASTTSETSGLQIRDATTLSDLSGLNSLSHINGSLWIRDNTNLTDLSGLENITSIDGFLWIISNTILTSLSGIQNIDPLTIDAPNSADLNINNNPNLSTCAISSICDFFDLTGMTSFVGNNAAGCDSQSEVELACAALPLPVEWLKPLTAKLDNDNIILNFSTATENNNNFFEIEHSTDDRDFQQIGRILGAGNSNVEINYQYIHKKPNEGTNYYRVKQVDYDGEYDYSNIAVVSPKPRSVTFYPNPTTDNINSLLSEAKRVTIYTALGVVLDRLELEAGDQELFLKKYGQSILLLQVGEEWIRVVVE